MQTELSMKWSELKRKALKAGYVLYAHGKKHDIYMKDEIRISIPRHDAQEIPKGLCESILKQMGLK